MDAEGDTVICSAHVTAPNGAVYVYEEIPDMVFRPGDANGDGAVTDADAAILATNWQACDVVWAQGDFNGDGCVTDADAAILATHWQEGVGEGESNPVPEPGTLVLLLGALTALAVLRRG